MVLNGGLGILPLAPITAVEVAGLPPVIAAVQERVTTELPDQQGKEFLLAMRVLMGLKYQDELTESLMQSIVEMEDSVEWQKIFSRGLVRGKAEGLVEGERRVLVRQGIARFGPPSNTVMERLMSIDDAEKLSQIAVRLLAASGWDDLFAA